jgi:2-polyprenyl-6-methoxyphenol hydroxylase-like FAD-dependent oxidoreductase
VHFAVEGLVNVRMMKWAKSLKTTHDQFLQCVTPVIDATSEDQILLHGIYDHAPLRRWSRGRIVLLGDAAHLMTPNLGQGAAAALEDACTLARCLAEGGTLAHALAAYENVRRVRTAFIAWQARQIGRIIQWENPLLCGLRDAGMRLLPDWIGEWALAPVFRFRV